MLSQKELREELQFLRIQIASHQHTTINLLEKALRLLDEVEALIRKQQTVDNISQMM